jgi:O-glycosyl hydrolase
MFCLPFCVCVWVSACQAGKSAASSQINQIIALPWSPPAWMKVPDTLFGGVLRNTAFMLQTYAEYFAKFAVAYNAVLDIPLYALALQNEPLYVT